MNESPYGIVTQGVIAVALIGAAAFLAWIEPSTRSGLATAFALAIGGVVGYFFSQRSNAAGSAQTLNGASHMAALIAAGTPGPTGATGPMGPASKEVT